MSNPTPRFRGVDHRSPWAKAQSGAALPVPGVDEIVDIKLAVRLIADRLTSTYEQRAIRDKTRKLIISACNSGELVSSDQVFKFGDLVAWAQTKSQLQSAVQDLPALHHASAALVAPKFGLSAFAISLPQTLTECQHALKAALIELNDLRQQKLSLQTQINDLQPYKDKAMARSEAGRKAGKKGGRGNEA